MSLPFGFRPALNKGGDTRLFRLRIVFKRWNDDGTDCTANIIDWIDYPTIDSGTEAMIGIKDWNYDEIPAWRFYGDYCNPALPIISPALQSAIYGGSQINAAWANMAITATQHTTVRHIENIGGVSVWHDHDVYDEVPQLSFALFGIKYDTGGPHYYSLGTVDAAAINAYGLYQYYTLTNLVKTYLDSGRHYTACAVVPVLPGFTLQPGAVATEEFLYAMALQCIQRDLSIDAENCLVGTITFKALEWDIPTTFNGVVQINSSNSNGVSLLAPGVRVPRNHVPAGWR